MKEEIGREKETMKKYIIVPLAAIFLLVAGIFVYIGNYYHASEAAMAMVETPAEDLCLTVDLEGRMIFEPDVPAESGIIFYPGGKVQAESYVPLLSALAEEGVLTVLVPMPANLAVLDVKAADGIVEELNYVEDWYMAGHSLGGSMAASYLEKQAGVDAFEGLILLASYSAVDLSQSSYEVLTIYGDQDGVMDMAKYEDCYDNLPVNLTHENIIKGGNHSQFGDYGHQKGDGKASIPGKEQIRQTVEAIVEFVQ